MTIPESRVETESGKAGVYKELALIELFLRKLSQQQGQASIVLACLFSSFFFVLFTNGGSSI